MDSGGKLIQSTFQRGYRIASENYKKSSKRVSILLGLVRSELEMGMAAPVSFRQRLWLWRRGYTSRSGVLFDLTNNNHDRYISEYQEGLTYTINEDWMPAMDNKLTSHLLLLPFEDVLPHLYGVLNNGNVKHDSAYNLDDALIESGSSNAGRVNESAAGPYIEQVLIENGPVILKPVFGSGGRGVFVLRSVEEGYRLNGEAVSRSEIDNLFQELNQYLIFEFVEQSPFMSELYPDASNTVRIITMWDYESQEPFIAMVTARVGTRQSAPVDNIKQGGLLAGIDIDTGELFSVASIPTTPPFDVELYETHPETGRQLVGRSIPNWNEITRDVVHMASWYPYIPYIAWDILPTTGSQFNILEINSSAGIINTQLHYQFLKDPRVRRFYEHHDVL